MNSSPLELAILDLVKKSILGEEKSRTKSIHVTDLTGPCMRKVWYRVQGENEERTYESMAVMKLGTIVHELIILNKDLNEVSMAGNIFKMQPIDPKKINPTNFFDCVSGKLDDIVIVNGEKVIVDKKTYSSVTKKSAEDMDAKIYSKFEKKEIDDDYVFQLNEYKLLHYLKTGEEINKGAIVYLDTATRFARPRVFAVDLLPIEEIKLKIQEKLNQLKKASQTGEPPEGVPSWRCEYVCPFKKICPIPKLPNYQELIKR